ncbi:hypothetical protein VNO80_28579 [Phaseolus coccineus]|uniref:Uncharacterized protein n=1 Tax=Phaseolus coccineus TaxID=3886 RepID=A0AAN9LEG8_PHACN
MLSSKTRFPVFRSCTVELGSMFETFDDQTTCLSPFSTTRFLSSDMVRTPEESSNGRFDKNEMQCDQSLIRQYHIKNYITLKDDTANAHKFQHFASIG